MQIYDKEWLIESETKESKQVSKRMGDGMNERKNEWINEWKDRLSIEVMNKRMQLYELTMKCTNDC